jgi:meso-butanediol dehydrogenase/(S,S)-butanediol dehydrogenase/diacetyl reductase
MACKLKDRNALITGGSRGIGRAIAFRFAEEGANLFICSRSEGQLQQTANELKDRGAKVVSRVADVSVQDSVRAMVQYALEEMGPIDILVNNAGVGSKTRPFLEYSLEDFDQIVKVNLYGVFHVTQAVLPGMIARKRGKVINIASTAGKWGSRNQSAYNISKHGVVGLTRCVALEMAPYNINVNAICPWIVETDIIQYGIEQRSKTMGISKKDVVEMLKKNSPLGRFLKPEEIANLALFLASDDSDTMTAQSLSMCGGYIMV